MPIVCDQDPRTPTPRKPVSRFFQRVIIILNKKLLPNLLNKLIHYKRYEALFLFYLRKHLHKLLFDLLHTVLVKLLYLLKLFCLSNIQLRLRLKGHTLVLPRLLLLYPICQPNKLLPWGKLRLMTSLPLSMS